MRDMEESVAAAPSYNKDLSPVAKGNRTKRYRPHSPIPFTIDTIAGEHNTTTNHRLSPTASATSSEESTTAEEEETARCLLLLANNHFKHNKRHLEAVAAAAGSGGTCMYACKTCDRVFSSFQALGGHRASHKKPKHEKYNINNNVKVISTGNVCGVESPKIHTCSYCGGEFTSGQALGGHMRRHRPSPISPPSNSNSVEDSEPKPKPGPGESNKPRNGLCLDLNLPASEVENQMSGFKSRRQKSPEKLALSTAAPTLVDCHY